MPSASESRLRAALAGKSAVIVGMVSEAGEPCAMRGWGLTLLEGEPARCRVILDAEDLPTLQHPGPRRMLAITAGNISTLESVQLKGPASDPEPATERDLSTVAAYCDAFFSAVWEVDHMPRELMERTVPRAFVASELDVEEIYDQTPGPGAGRTLD